MALAGNTVILSFTFVDGNNAPIPPDGDVTVRLYAANGQQIGLDATIPQADAVSPGVYEHTYAVPRVKPPPSEAYFDYEGSAMVDGSLQTGRKREPIVWVRR